MNKQKAFRSRKYLDWVKSLDCVGCGSPADDPHHAIGLGLGGMGMKAPDTFTKPMCRGCHTEIHNKPELWAGQWEFIAKTISQAVAEGILCIK